MHERSPSRFFWGSVLSVPLLKHRHFPPFWSKRENCSMSAKALTSRTREFGLQASASKKLAISRRFRRTFPRTRKSSRSEEHTSELQSRFDLVCRLLLEK